MVNWFLGFSVNLVREETGMQFLGLMDQGFLKVNLSRISLMKNERL